LYLINSNLKFKNTIKDRLFYDRFQYCITFNLDEVSCLRELSHAHVDQMIERRKQWREIAQQRWVNGKQGSKSTILLGRRWKDIIPETIENLHILADLLLTSTSDYKLVVSVDQGWIYSNDLDLIDRVDQMPCLRYKQYSQAIIDRPKNTVKLKKSQYQYRSYLRSVKLTVEQKNQLAQFLENQQTNARLSPALLPWLQTNFNRTQDYFFIDYHIPQWLTMLALVHPGLIRKTVQIITAK